MSTNTDPSPSSGNNRRMVVSLIALVIALVGVCLCLFGMLMIATPALAPDYVTSTGRNLKLSEGVIAGMICMIPGFLTAFFAGGLWLIAGRRR